MITGADAICSDVWLRFIPHDGVDKFVEHRLHGFPDQGGFLSLEDCDVMILPAHYLHACGNFQVYDPISKILYTGDLGASIGIEYQIVPDFDAHIPFMKGFHERYMGSTKAVTAWAKMVRQLDIEMIAPQHGAAFQGKEMVNQFIDWLDSLTVGIDILESVYQLPRHG